MGMLYNAFREGTPLLVTAGQQDRRLQVRRADSVGAHGRGRAALDQVVRRSGARRGSALGHAPGRANRPHAADRPGVPVAADGRANGSWPKNSDLTPPRLPDRRVRPPQAALERAADVLLGAKNPAILVGSRVQEADAVDELVRLAERLGAPVISESGTTHGRLGFPSDHPLYAQGLPLWSPEVRERLKEFDVLLVVGMDLLRQYVYHEPARAIPEHIRLVHLDEDP